MSSLSAIRRLPDNIRSIVLASAIGAILAGTGCTNLEDTVLFEGADNSEESIDSDLVAEAASTTSDTANAADADFEVSDWTTETHTKDVEPDFNEVFDDTQVKRLDFVVTPERWQAMLDDMTATYGEFGDRSGDQNNGSNLASTANSGPGRGTDPNLQPTEPPDVAPGTVPDPATDPDAFTGSPPAERTQADTLLESDEDPIFVPADVYYNGRQWYSVGIRFKGNSTLMGSWQSGILKLSFKMDFDEFEDDYPQIDNQRFYGFKKFSLKNNYLDQSQMREKVASDVFRNAGLAVSHTAFYSLYVDYGNGPEYFGLYTLVEEVDGTVIDTQFSSDDGNLYKPEDSSANFVDGSFFSDDFVKKTNEDEEDWSDIIALFDALHDDSASTASETWRENLEAVFDVDGFLKYLAVNGIIQNWDTYGQMPHNYYLYNDPDSNQLTWIPWDNNEALQEGKQGGALALDFSNLDESEWPLIARIYADDVYRARYNDYLFEVISDAFETSSIHSDYENYKALIAPYATTEQAGFSFLNSVDDFYNAVDVLLDHASDRAAAVSTYLSAQ